MIRLAEAFLSWAVAFVWRRLARLLERPIRCKRALLVTAHPDDETMFFAPTLLSLDEAGCDTHLLCLSKGDAYGLGDTRKNELLDACNVLKVPPINVKVIDHDKLQDGMQEIWDETTISALVAEEVQRHCIDTIITFDAHGVSGHPNHSATFRGIMLYLQSQEGQKERPCVWTLVSCSVFRQFSGVVNIPATWLISHPSAAVILTRDPAASWMAMRQHASQWVWFRWLFIAFSSYVYINALLPIQFSLSGSPQAAAKGGRQSSVEHCTGHKARKE
ncbi:unnamed protein product [Ostreobium quekettii]|uniref:N-acetylglucosaminylphosphatidylinositol deacetylase n=1 Tax=Ostreobium quekettii TaxID=121088 RepID=A0A8S1JDT5_9CHLO|nr:unnamed protein product [Ostreobium quekettii]